MKMQINFHKKTGLTPGLYPFRAKYGKAGTVYGLRLWWSALTLYIKSSYDGPAMVSTG
jgi:hypothetical protein